MVPAQLTTARLWDQSGYVSKVKEPREYRQRVEHYSAIKKTTCHLQKTKWRALCLAKQVKHRRGGFLKNRLKSRMGTKHPGRLEEEGLMEREKHQKWAEKGVT